MNQGQPELWDFRRTAQAPLLLLLDRRNDPVTPLLTQWTYQAMVHELLGIQNGRVSLEGAPDVRDEVKVGFLSLFSTLASLSLPTPSLPPFSPSSSLTHTPPAGNRPLTRFRPILRLKPLRQLRRPRRRSLNLRQRLLDAERVNAGGED